MLYSCCIETLISACRDPYKFCLYCPATHVTSQVLQGGAKRLSVSITNFSVHLLASNISADYSLYQEDTRKTNKRPLYCRHKKTHSILLLYKLSLYFSSTNCLFTSLVQIVSLLLVPLFKKRIFANTKTCWKSNLNGNVENACLK